MFEFFERIFRNASYSIISDFVDNIDENTTVEENGIRFRLGECACADEAKEMIRKLFIEWHVDVLGDEVADELLERAVANIDKIFKTPLEPSGSEDLVKSPCDECGACCPEHDLLDNMIADDVHDYLMEKYNEFVKDNPDANVEISDETIGSSARALYEYTQWLHNKHGVYFPVPKSC